MIRVGVWLPARSASPIRAIGEASGHNGLAVADQVQRLINVKDRGLYALNRRLQLLTLAETGVYALSAHGANDGPGSALLPGAVAA